MEPTLLFWWVKVDELLEEQSQKGTLMFHRGAFSPPTAARALCGR